MSLVPPVETPIARAFTGTLVVCFVTAGNGTTPAWSFADALIAPKQDSTTQAIAVRQRATLELGQTDTLTR